MTKEELEALVAEWVADFNLDLKAFETDELIARICEACGVDDSDAH